MCLCLLLRLLCLVDGYRIRVNPIRAGGLNQPALYSDGYFSMKKGVWRSKISWLFLIHYNLSENQKKLFCFFTVLLTLNLLFLSLVNSLKSSSPSVTTAIDLKLSILLNNCKKSILNLNLCLSTKMSVFELLLVCFDFLALSFFNLYNSCQIYCEVQRLAGFFSAHGRV